MSMQPMFSRALAEMGELLRKLEGFGPAMQQLGDAMMSCWDGGGKVLIAGNGGSAADAMHFAEELVARYAKNRRALAAIALCDPTVITCAANDFGFDRIFSRQVEALGNRGDLLIVMTTSGNSQNLILAIEAAKARGMRTAAMLGRDGGKAKGMCDIEMIVPAQPSGRIQEAHKLMYHTICEWVDSKVD
ncbi:MAG TPA: SIS domain-containing protein [Tepidisphaeraceae bacterium]|jgi:D-sedoheptulose 7-phosphate isomerase|nr:SIS domain-containing protein [Tepidisphaeraceae bacterium]